MCSKMYVSFFISQYEQNLLLDKNKKCESYKKYKSISQLADCGKSDRSAMFPALTNSVKALCSTFFREKSFPLKVDPWAWRSLGNQLPGTSFPSLRPSLPPRTSRLED